MPGASVSGSAQPTHTSTESGAGALPARNWIQAEPLGSVARTRAVQSATSALARSAGPHGASLVQAAWGAAAAVGKAFPVLS